MTVESRQVAVLIDRAFSDVYAFASDPLNLPRWASGLGATVTNVGGRWFVETPGGPLGVEFAPHNDFGVLDHYVTMPSGEVFYNPLRVFPNEDGCEAVFSVRRMPGLTDDEFARDVELVTADLERLKRVLEHRDVAL